MDAGSGRTQNEPTLQPGFADAHFDRTTGAYYEMTRGCSSAEQGRALGIDNIAPAPVGAGHPAGLIGPDARHRFNGPCSVDT